MAEQTIPVGVYALDQFDLPEPRPGVGLAARLAETAPILRADPKLTWITLLQNAGSTALAHPIALSGQDLPEGVRVTAEPVAGSFSLLLVRAGGRPIGLARGGASGRAERPELLGAFIAGTLIDTPDGLRRAEDLTEGDRVTTLANGSRRLIWTMRRRLLPVETLAYPGLRPLCLPSGAAGNARPLQVSPRQRVLITDWRAEVYFGEDRVLVAAEALSDSHDECPPFPAEGVDYVVLLCDDHAILLAEGALTESFHPGEAGIAALTPDERADLARVLPEADLARRRAAYPIVKSTEARALRIPG